MHCTVSAQRERELLLGLAAKSCNRAVPQQKSIPRLLTVIRDSADGVTVMSLIGSHSSSVAKSSGCFRLPVFSPPTKHFGSRKYVTEPMLRWLSLVVSRFRFCFWSKLAFRSVAGSISLTSFPITGLSFNRWLPCRMKVIVLLLSDDVYCSGREEKGVLLAN